MEKQEIIDLISIVIEDFDLLESGDWTPDDDSINASRENLEKAIKLINKLKIAADVQD